MQYISTRGGHRPVSAQEAILKGLAPDGGLYLPQELPSLSLSDLNRFTKLSYPERAASVLSLFLTDYTYEELLACASRAYGPASFPVQNPAPVSALTDRVSLLELYHGPTCAFKDFALQILPLLLGGALQKTGETRTAVILTATSGDTGKAALSGFADAAGTRIAVFYPEGGTSVIQRLQMTTQKGANVLVLAVKGNFDDAQNGVKAIFSDAALGERLSRQDFLLTSANSINWGRLAPQIAYYVSAYCDMAVSGRIAMGEPINVAVPTGNFGNILACYIAKLCGLPIGRLLCASNENDVLTEFLTTGVYNRNRPFHVTLSPSMDILISSNLERLLYLISGGDSEKVASSMRSLAEEGSYTIAGETLARIQDSFSAGSANDARTLAAIYDAWVRYGRLIDPHTAVALRVYQEFVQNTGDSAPTLIVSTASPFKFPASVLRALRQPVSGDDFANLDALSRYTRLRAPDSLSLLRGTAERFTGTVEKESMKDAIQEWLGA